MLDLDGTVVSVSWNLNEILKTRSKIISRLRDLGIEEETLSPNMATWKIIDVIRKKYGESVVRKARKIIYETLDPLDLATEKNAKIIGDAEKVIRELRRKMIKIVLVTYRSRASTISLLKKLKLYELFDLIITRDDVEEAKPHPQHFAKALSMLRLKANNVLVVSDLPEDLKTAMRLGFKVAAVLTGLGKKEDFLEAGVNVICKDLSCIPKILEELETASLV